MVIFFKNTKLFETEEKENHENTQLLAPLWIFKVFQILK